MNILSLLVLSIFMLFPNLSNASTTLVCPPDVWLNCGDDIWDLSPYGNAYYYVNGVQYSAGDPSVNYDLTVCETGRIFRTWTIMDPNWVTHSCTQTIYVRGSNFNYHNIDWPENDLVIQGCNTSTHPDNLPDGYGRPTYDYYPCSMVGSSYKDQVFYFGPDCKKILRTWTVLDWCNYYPGSINPGKWSYVQTIKISGTNTPVMTCPDDLELLPDDCYGRYVEMTDVLVSGQGCNGPFKVTNDSPYADENGADASGFYPIGTTHVNYKVEYACGEEQYCQQIITIKEKPPVPYCLATLNVALMPVDTDGDQLPDDGMVEVWAEDMDYASYHPCRPNEPLIFSFSSNIDSTSRVFSCADLGSNELQLWVTDTHGNQSWCAVELNVQNNAANIPNCEDLSQNVVGTVENVFEEPISQVEIELSSRAYYDMQYRYDTVMSAQVIDSFTNAEGYIIYIYDRKEQVIRKEEQILVPGFMMHLMSNEDGRFEAEELNKNRRYVLTAYKEPDSEGVSLADVVILQRYISGEYSFSNKYSYISADMNEDGEINNEDLVALRAIVLGNTTSWPNDRKWLFFNKFDLDEIDEESSMMEMDLEQRIVLDNDLIRFEEQGFVGIMKGGLESLEAEYHSFGTVNRSRDIVNTKVYPNPMLDELIIEYSNDSNSRVQIFNMDGRIMYDATIGSGQSTIDVSTWPSSSYVYKISNGLDTETGRIIKLD